MEIYCNLFIAKWIDDFSGTRHGVLGNKSATHVDGAFPLGIVVFVVFKEIHALIVANANYGFVIRRRNSIDCRIFGQRQIEVEALLYESVK